MNQAKAAPPDRPVRTLPVLASVAEAYLTVYRHAHLIPAVAAMPVFVYVTAVLCVMLFVSTGGETADAGFLQPDAVNTQLGAFVTSVAHIVGYVLVAVAWHRLVLLGPVDGHPSYLTFWQARHWGFFGRLIGIFLINAAVLFIPILLLAAFIVPGLMENPEAGLSGTALMMYLAVLVLSYAMFVRLAFVLPPAAIGETYALKDSWNQTKGQTLRLLAGTLLTTVPIILFSVAVQAITLGGSRGEVGQVPLSLTILEYVMGLIQVLLSVSFLSIAFKICSGWVPGQSSPE